MVAGRRDHTKAGSDASVPAVGHTKPHAWKWKASQAR